VQTDQWKTLPPMSIGRHDHSSIYHKDHLYIVGGCGEDDNRLVIVESLDMNTLQWSHLPPLPHPLYDTCVVFFSNNLFVLGGI
ncbi:hypothetical protein CAPTEDRAFT_79643, partial [Capitella teleta]